MATYNLTPSQTIVPTSAMGLLNGRVPCVVEMCVDFESSPSGIPSTVTGISGTSGTVIDCINVPAGFAILSTGIEVLKVDSAGNSGTLTVKVGSASQGSAETVATLGFVAGAGTMTPVVPSGTAAMITVTVGTGTINGVVRVFATLLDQRARLGCPVAIGTQTNPAGQTTVYAWDPVFNYTTTLNGGPLTYVL
jgi:hypothetical protein